MPIEESSASKAEPEVKQPAAPVTVDGGLGLEGFLTPSPEKEPDGEKEEKKETPDEDTKGGDEDAAKEPDKKDDKKPDESAAASPEGDVKKEETPAPDVAKDAAKEAKKEDEPKVEDKPKVDYESLDNPYIKRHRDTQNWATDLNKKFQTLQRTVEIQEKKLAGTYNEETDNPQPTAEDIEADAEFKGRTKASRVAAVSMFGEEQTTKDLDEFTRIFGNDQYIIGSITNEDQPAIEAIKMLRRHEFFEEYGYQPTEIIEKIRVKVRKEETEKIREEEAAKLATRIKAKDGEPAGLAGLTAKSGDSTTEKSKGPEPLTSLFEK